MNPRTSLTLEMLRYVVGYKKVPMSSDSSANPEEASSSSNEEVSDTEGQPSGGEDDFIEQSTKRDHRLYAKRAPSSKGTGRVHEVGREIITFTSQLSIEATEENLAKVFMKNYEDATKQQLVVSDQLSVRDLRVIVRVLKLCDSTAGNQRKPYLCQMIQNHMKTKAMRAIHERVVNENLIKMASSENDTNTRSNTTNPTSADTEENRGSFDKDGDKHHSHSGRSKKRKANKTIIENTTENQTKQTDPNAPIIPRLVLDESFSLPVALEFLQKCNQFVWEISDRLTEMERALTIINRKLDEIEVFYGTPTNFNQ